MADFLFCGDWIDEEGRVLRIEVCPDGRFLASFLGRDRITTLVPNLVAGEFPTVNMLTSFNQGRLIVELGLPHLGPTMSLEYSADKRGKSALIPEVRMGLVDDWLPDFGVPWVFPLSIYRPLGD